MNATQGIPAYSMYRLDKYFPFSVHIVRLSQLIAFIQWLVHHIFEAKILEFVRAKSAMYIHSTAFISDAYGCFRQMVKSRFEFYWFVVGDIADDYLNYNLVVQLLIIAGSIFMMKAEKGNINLKNYCSSYAVHASLIVGELFGFHLVHISTTIRNIT